jgi:NADH:ubiquinone oxidoreductase subunit 2 (subunit N)
LLIISLIQLLLSNSASIKRDKSILYSRVAIAILILTILITYNNLFLLFLSKGIGLFSGLFHSTSITNVFHIFIILISSIILNLTSFYPRKYIIDNQFYVLYNFLHIIKIIKSLLHIYSLKKIEDKQVLSTKFEDKEILLNKVSDEKNREVDFPINKSIISDKKNNRYTGFPVNLSKISDEENNGEIDFPVNMSKVLKKIEAQYKILEYSLIILFIISGALFLICTSDLVSIFLSIELQSYGLYLISTIYRDSEKATAGGLMYFLLGGLSSCFILLSTSLLYSNSGTTTLDSLYIIINIYDVSKDSLISLLY